MTQRSFLSRKWSGLVWRAGRYRRRFFHRPRHFLAIYAIMQNEAHILREWLDIHLREGFEHFFLLDHGSTDDWHVQIREYLDGGMVTVRTLGTQEGSLDKLRLVHSPFALDGAEWLIMQDLDEFTYAPGQQSIAAFLRGLPDDVHQVAIPWIRFGTGGNVEHPRYIVSNCLRSEDMSIRSGFNDAEDAWPVKSLFRPRHLRVMHQHMHDVEGMTIAPLDERVPVAGHFHIPNRLAAQFGEFRILQNHYVHQSLEFYRQKMQRRGYWLEMNRGEKSYTMERFEREEQVINAVENRQLFEKHRDYYDRLAAAR
jgi:hypothetical protein